MNRTLGKRHELLAHNTAHSRDMDMWILDESDAETRSRPDIDESTRDFLDFTNAISGDDLARINAFEPTRKPRLWSDVQHKTWRAAA